MHFGWDIGKAFGKPRLHTATFIERVFAHILRDSEVSILNTKCCILNSSIRLNRIERY